MRFIFILLSLIMAFTPLESFAASSFEPAFKTLGVWNAQTQARIDLNIWYPTHSRPSPANYAPWTLNVVRYGRSAKGRFPLVLLSHDTTATRFSYHETAAIFAKSGFVVIAPAHKNDNLNHIPNPFSLRQLTERAEELNIALDVALNHEAIMESIDPERIGILGFGMGASAALLLGNASPTANNWAQYCTAASKSALYCEPWVRQRIQTMANELPLKQSYAQPRIKSIAAVAPSLSMLFDKNALQKISAQILLVEATEDSVNLEPWNTEHLVQNFSKKVQFTRIEHADLTDLMSACPTAIRESLPELCGQLPSEVRINVHEQLNTALIQFFLSTLGHIQAR